MDEDWQKKKKALRDAVKIGNADDVLRILLDDFELIKEDIGDIKNSIFCEKDTALVLASKFGHYECIKQLLECGANIYIKGEEKFGYRYIPHDFIGAIVNAAIQDHLKCLQLLAGTRILKSCPKDKHYTSFLQEFMENAGDSGYIQNLLSNLADVDKKCFLEGWRGQNLLTLLLLHNNDISILVDGHNLPVNSWDFNGLTPLIIAILIKDLKSAKYLLSKGADMKMPEMTNMNVFEPDGRLQSDSLTINNEEWDVGNGRTALMFAACMRNAEMARLLIEYVPSEVLNWSEGSKGFTPLMFAASSGDIETVKLFLKHGAIVNMIDYSGITPLDCAITSEDQECVELLLGKVVPEFYGNAFVLCIFRDVPNLLLAVLKYFNEPDFIDILDQSHLMDAIVYDSLKCAQVLIDNGHDVDLKNHSGMTALMLACMEGKEEGIKLLLKNGADVNAQSNEGITSVMFSICRVNVKCLKLLLDHNADLNLFDNHKGTVFSAAMRHKGPCLKILLDSGQLFDDDGDQKSFKLVHKESMREFRSGGILPISNLITAVQHQIFDFDWTNMHSLPYMCFAAVTSGISPAKFERKSMVSFVTFTFQASSDFGIIKYLLSNLYFLPEDYSFIQKAALIISDNRRTASEMGHTTTPEEEQGKVTTLAFYESSYSQPLSLKVWSFLHVSKAITMKQLSDSNNIQRSSLVNSLPIPESLKKKLNFIGPFSQLCRDHWHKIGMQERKSGFSELAGLIFEKSLFSQNPTSLVKCQVKECECEGLGRIL